MTYCPSLRHFVHSSANGLHLDIILHTFNHNRFIRIVVRFESFGMLEQLTNKSLTNGAQNICVLPIVMRRIVLDTNCLLQVLPTQSPYHYDCSVTLSAYVVTTASILFFFSLLSSPFPFLSFPFRAADGSAHLISLKKHPSKVYLILFNDSGGVKLRILSTFAPVFVRVPTLFTRVPIYSI